MTVHDNALIAKKRVFNSKRVGQCLGEILLHSARHRALSAHRKLRINLLHLEVARLIDEGYKISPRQKVRHAAMIDDDSGTVNQQTDKFKEAARALKCDDDDTRFEERVKKLVKHKPVSEKGT